MSCFTFFKCVLHCSVSGRWMASPLASTLHIPQHASSCRHHARYAAEIGSRPSAFLKSANVPSFASCDFRTNGVLLAEHSCELESSGPLPNKNKYAVLHIHLKKKKRKKERLIISNTRKMWWQNNSRHSRRKEYAKHLLKQRSREQRHKSGG